MVSLIRRSKKTSYLITNCFNNFVNSFPLYRCYGSVGIRVRFFIDKRLIAFENTNVLKKFLLKHRLLRGQYLAAALLILTVVGGARPQEIVDRLVATVSDGTSVEVITLSDIKWQLALQPGISLDPIGKEDIERARDSLIDQRIFALEAKRFPRPAPDASIIKGEIERITRFFPTLTDFEQRLRAVGFSSIKDENFERLIAQRVAIERYVEFRFSSFVVVTPDEINRYYRETYVPSFRRRQPGVVVPSLEEQRNQIRAELVEERVADRISVFLDDAKRRIEVDLINEP